MINMNRIYKSKTITIEIEILTTFQMSTVTVECKSKRYI